MDGLACPCGLGDAYESCCGRLHAGAAAPTAESLMRSRYSAYATGDAGYLLRTWHPSARPPTLSLDPSLRWTRLAVLQTRGGGLLDATGTVQFRAIYRQHGQRGVLTETSRFARHDRHWTYLGPVELKERLPSRAITQKKPRQTTQQNGSISLNTRVLRALFESRRTQIRQLRRLQVPERPGSIRLLPGHACRKPV